MAEVTLSPEFVEINLRVGIKLGYSSTIGNWSTDQTNAVDRVIQSGYRQFLFPPPLPGESAGHVWSFLKPDDTFDTVAGTDDYTMEDDFGGAEGPLTFATDDNGYIEVPLVPHTQILAKRQGMNQNVTGPPQLVGLHVKTPTYTTGQRYEALVWPTPDAVYTLKFKKVHLPPKLTTTNKYPMGGLQHGETVAESCLAVAEREIGDTMGVHHAAFMQYLAASVAADRAIQAPEFYGRDTGGRGKSGGNWDRTQGVALVNGVQYVFWCVGGLSLLY